MDEKKLSTRPSEDGTLVGDAQRHEDKSKPAGTLDHEEALKLENPLTGKSREELKADVETFCDRNDLGEHRELCTPVHIGVADPVSLQGRAYSSDEGLRVDSRSRAHRR